MTVRWIAAAVLTLTAGILWLQTATAQSLGPDHLDYYLQQALQADRPGSRLPLNHIGVQGEEVPEGFLLTAVLEDYPAHQAGLYRGDIILRANGARFHPVYSFNSRDQAPRFQPSRQPLLLELQRDDERLEVSVAPVFENLLDSYRSATLNSVQQFPSGNKMVGYLRLWVLSRNSADLIAYQQLFGELRGSDGIILDLRDAVGFVDPAQLQLIYRGATDLYQLAEPGIPDWLRIPAHSAPLTGVAPYRNPVALLINDRTRGGAELLAYQLDKLNRVISLGERSAGQLGDWIPGADQPVLNYQPATGLQVDGQQLESAGYLPERPVSYPRRQAGRIDPQFQAAMDLLMGII